MAEYRKKPVVVEATRWWKNGDHPKDHSAVLKVKGETFLSEGHVVRRFRRPDVSDDSECQHCAQTMHDHGWIDTLEGGHIVCPGDWIITGVKGERYPCKPDVFEATDEEADGPPSLLDLCGAKLSLKSLAVIGKLLQTDGCANIIGVMTEPEPLTVDEWLERMIQEERRQPDPREFLLRNLATAHTVEFFEFEGRILFPMYGTSGMFTATLCAFLVRWIQTQHECDLQKAWAFPMERAEVFPCGCRCAPMKFPPYPSNDTEQIFNAALESLDAAQPKEKS